MRSITRENICQFKAIVLCMLVIQFKQMKMCILYVKYIILLENQFLNTLMYRMEMFAPR